MYFVKDVIYCNAILYYLVTSKLRTNTNIISIKFPLIISFSANLVPRTCGFLYMPQKMSRGNVVVLLHLFVLILELVFYRIKLF